jgi:MarR family transcriptional regulator for hemolysin
MSQVLKVDRARFAPLVSHLAREWRRVIDGRLHAYGLTEATWLPLLRIARSETPMRQNELAASLSLDGSSIVRLIDALEKAGLVNRREDALDRRAKSLVLTAKGQRTVDQVERVSLEVRDVVLGDIPEADFASALGLLEAVRARLADLSDARPAAAEPRRAANR